MSPESEGACSPAGPPRRSGRSARSLLAAGLLGSLCVAGCVAPAFDSGAFTHNAIEALDSAQSQTRTAYLAVQAKLDDKLTQPYVDNVVTESEDAMGPIEDSFGNVDPPTAADGKLRDDVGQLLSDAADVLSTARIAVREHDEPGMRQSVKDLGSLADQLEKKSQALP